MKLENQMANGTKHTLRMKYVKQPNKKLVQEMRFYNSSIVCLIVLE